MSYTLIHLLPCCVCFAVLICSVDTENYEITTWFFSLLGNSLSFTLSLSLSKSKFLLSSLLVDNFKWTRLYSLWVHSLIRSTFSSLPLTLSMMAGLFFWNGFRNLRTHQYGKTLKSLSLCSVIKAYEAHSHSKNLIALVGEIVCHKNKFIFLLYYE